MKRFGVFSSAADLGGQVSHYRRTQKIYRQGTPAHTLFYIEKGGVRLSTRLNHRPEAVTAILGAGDVFGELCLAGYPLRMSTAVALTDSSIRIFERTNMLGILRKNNDLSNSFITYLLSNTKRYREHIADLMTSSAEQRLLRVLLRLGNIRMPALSQGVLAEMVGTTRSRVCLFMKRLKRKGFITYEGGLKVHRSLRKALQRE
jgi:CRP/FNR family cyclic AMP-dependent transcriptional regulator